MKLLWNSAIDRLSTKVSPHNFEMWLRPIEFAGSEDGVIRLRAPNPYVKLWFESNYLPAVLTDLRENGIDHVHVELDVVPMPAAELQLAPVSSVEVVSPAPEPSAPPANLNRRYTFQTFVPGPSNQLAHAAARAVAGPETSRYNPLFICGGAGLGKTHLLHAIGIEFAKTHPAARILYLSGEQFVNDFVQSIGQQRMPEFRRRFREDCDLLLLDDIQFIANKDSTQEEFFHTFNALYEKQRQIVLSADRKPHEIPDVADRLRTRFAWGLLADIEPPELEVRLAILRQKAHAENIPLDDEVSMYIAQAVRTNVRELEGALIRLSASASLTGEAITVAFAHRVLEGRLSRPSERPTVEQVLKAVASYYHITVPDLRSDRRPKSIAGPRAVAMFLARKHTAQSFPDLGRAFGGKHHTTVLSACEKIEERLDHDPALRAEIHALEALLVR